jgi:hypothetical protein
VVPALLLTMARLYPIRQLKMVDLPELGNPIRDILN